MKVITKTSIKQGCIVGKSRPQIKGTGVSTTNAVKVESAKGLDSDKKIEEKKPLMNDVIKKLERVTGSLKRKNIRFNP